MFGPTILVVNPTGPSESETRRDPSDGEEAPVTPAVDVSVKEGSPAGVRVTDGEPLDSPSVAASAATVPVRKSGRAEREMCQGVQVIGSLSCLRGKMRE